MLVEQIDDVGVEALERGVCYFLNVLRPAIQAHNPLGAHARVGDLEAKLSCDDDTIPHAFKGFADKLLICKRPIYFGSVKKCDAQVESAVQCRDGSCFFLAAIGECHSHTADADG